MKNFIKTISIYKSIVLTTMIMFFILCYPIFTLVEELPTEEAYFQGVHLLEIEKNYDEALQIFKKILGKNPNHAEAHFQMGNIYRQMELPEKAKIYYQLQKKY